VLDDGSISFCILPYGTGNDLALVMGWGNQPKDIWTEQLQSLAQEVINA
jgi:diacylglycerol kinase family enzyme